MSLATRTATLRGEAAMARLAEDVALLLRPGMTLALRGDLGAGKTTFARALLRALAGNSELEVPSPTFTLLQPYEFPRFPVAHVDCYRLAGPEEAAVLDLDEWRGRGAVVAEWPERIGLAPGPEVIEIAIAFADEPNARSLTFTAPEDVLAGFDRGREIRRFLDRSGWPEAERRFLQGDASTRRFERIRRGDRCAVLMDAPGRPDPTPVRNGKAYSTLARLAEDVRPFVAISEALRARGLSAPELYASDLDAGLLMVEDLGDEKIVDAAGRVVPERYATAVDLLAHLHSQPMPSRIPLPDGGSYRLPAFDCDVMDVELSVFFDWYLPAFAEPVDEAGRRRFAAVWEPLYRRLAASEQHWLLRDFHSPNLMWLENRAGIRRIGLIDYQDALLGPSAYDVASVLQDARTVVPADLEAELLQRYLDQRRRVDAGFDAANFRDAYAICCAQRAIRILGIFTRLRDRDGKPDYVRRLPQLRAYLGRTLGHPMLGDLRAWLAERHILDEEPLAAPAGRAGDPGRVGRPA